MYKVNVAYSDGKSNCYKVPENMLESVVSKLYTLERVSSGRMTVTVDRIS